MLDTELKNLLWKLHLSPRFRERQVVDALQKAGIPANEYFVTSGATKICLAFKNSPYVLKWATDGMDDALQEINLYVYALEEGIGAFFPKTEFFCTVNGISFVKQQRVGMSMYDIWGCPRMERKILRTIPKTPLKPIDESMLYRLEDNLDCSLHASDLWSMAALAIYGRDKCEILCHFLTSNHINDLHDRNIGFLGIAPVILDFSGFYD